MPEEVSTISTGSLVLTLGLGFLLLVLPRRYALAPMLIGGCYLTLGQALVIAGLHFYLIRILIFFALIRIVIRREIFYVKLNGIDKVFIGWILAVTFLYLIFSGNYATLNERLGNLYNSIGIYFFARSLIWSFDDVVLTVKMLAIIILPLAMLFAVEHATGKNPFYVFGGVSEFSEIRDGRIRCQGPFRHPILAGTFGATVMPLFVGLWVYNARNRLLAIGGFLAATFIVFTASSGGPLMAYITGLVGLICWVFRYQMRAIRWGIVFLFMALTLYMKAPIWFVISHLSGLVGGGGWYRSALIDAAIRHFNEWWLIGTEYTAHWMPFSLATNPNMVDITNHFIAQGVNGGLLALLLFIWLIVKCFQATGKAIHNEESYSGQEQFMIWSLGCAVLCHVASFFSVSYFDQIIIFWYLNIALIATIAPHQNGVLDESEPKTGPGALQFST